MYWSINLINHLIDAPWPATKVELIEYAMRNSSPEAVVENLKELLDDDMPYKNIEELWPDMPDYDEFHPQEDGDF